MPVSKGCYFHCQMVRSLEHHAPGEAVQPEGVPLCKDELEPRKSYPKSTQYGKLREMIFQPLCWSFTKLNTFDINLSFLAKGGMTSIKCIF